MPNTFLFLDPWKQSPSTLPMAPLPPSFHELAQAVAAQPTQEAALRLAYERLGSKYRGYRVLTFLRLDWLLVNDFEKLWKKSGFLHCHHMNYLLRTLLVASGKFLNASIRGHWTQIWIFSPHQYLTVQLDDGREIDVDLWGKAYGIPFGKHASGFRAGSMMTRV